MSFCDISGIKSDLKQWYFLTYESLEGIFDKKDSKICRINSTYNRFLSCIPGKHHAKILSTISAGI